MNGARATAAEIARAVSSGTASARETVAAALRRIELHNGALGAFTDVVAQRALVRAEALDEQRIKGKPLGPLGGVPFAVKNLIDIAGLPTRAGSKINRDRTPASADATLVRRLEAAGAVLVGALNMGEYAYDFTGENVHDGPSRNPHDLTRMSGGSSGGSGSAVAGGLVPLALGSDTNGSIRVPSSLCGLFGLKPTYGRLSRAGSFPFVASLDHLGPIARSALDLALAYDAVQGQDPADPVCQPPGIEPATPHLDQGAAGLKIAVADGYFAAGGRPEALAAVGKIANALGVTRRIEIAEARRARAAAYVITAAEGAALHRKRLQTRAADFDPAVRDRLLAGSMIPAQWVLQAQRFRRWFHDRVLELFREVDILLAPATPCVAPKLGQKTFVLDGVEMPVRANLGLFTQPISFVGLPVVAVPIKEAGDLPIGVQVIAAPWNESLALRVAHDLERQGVATASVPNAFAAAP